MPEGVQSKEGLYELMYPKLREKLSALDANNLAIAIIDALQEKTRDCRSVLVFTLKHLGDQLIKTSQSIIQS